MDGEPRSTSTGPSPLPDKLNHLFEAVRPRDGRPYSNEHVATAVEQASGITISQSYIWQLRKGKKDNPTLKHLQALANFFGVPAAYFFDDEVTARVNQQLETLRAEQACRESNDAHDQARLMAMRAGELSPERRRQVMELLDVVYALEQAERSAGTGEGGTNG
ncbi:MAG: helix-turn-helix domain-containing protein [Actinomycetota bacterium]|nr:helix-turn-helix domain-containing protein [Actinomycetota bacterium]